jgi:hypothetical protein
LLLKTGKVKPVYAGGVIANDPGRIILNSEARSGGNAVEQLLFFKYKHLVGLLIPATSGKECDYGEYMKIAFHEHTESYIFFTYTPLIKNATSLSGYRFQVTGSMFSLKHATCNLQQLQL